jgi:hypothetical protein
VSITGAYAYGTEHLPLAPAAGSAGGVANGEPNGVAAAGSGAGGPRGPGVTGGQPCRSFDLAFQLVAAAGLERLVSALYPLDRYREAIEHAAHAGARGATKVAFDLRTTKKFRTKEIHA